MLSKSLQLYSTSHQLEIHNGNTFTISRHPEQFEPSVNKKDMYSPLQK